MWRYVVEMAILCKQLVWLVSMEKVNNREEKILKEPCELVVWKSIITNRYNFFMYVFLFGVVVSAIFRKKYGFRIHLKCFWGLFPIQEDREFSPLKELELG